MKYNCNLHTPHCHWHQEAVQLQLRQARQGRTATAPGHKQRIAKYVDRARKFCPWSLHLPFQPAKASALTGTWPILPCFVRLAKLAPVVEECHIASQGLYKYQRIRQVTQYQHAPDAAFHMIRIPRWQVYNMSALLPANVVTHMPVQISQTCQKKCILQEHVSHPDFGDPVCVTCQQVQNAANRRSSETSSKHDWPMRTHNSTYFIVCTA